MVLEKSCKLPRQRVDLGDPPLLVLMFRVNKVKQSEMVIGLMFCNLLLVIFVNSSVHEVGLEV